MSYLIVWEIPALAALRRLRQIDPAGAKLLRELIDSLSDDPRPEDSSRLGDSEYWRLRAGSYRAIYRIEGASVTVHVINVGRVPGHR